MCFAMPGPESLAAQPAAAGRWLAIVGIGEDGVAGLSPTARRLVAEAAFVFGGKRHLALAEAIIKGERQAWPSPFEGAVGEVLARRGSKVCVLASGDPFVHGIGALLAREVPVAEMEVVPAPSAFSLAAARLGWPLPEVTTLALHARPLDLLRPHLFPGARILALTADSTTPAAIAALLAASGFGESRVTVLEALGGPRERIRAVRADAFDLADVDPLNLVAIEVVTGAGAQIIPRAPGLPDSAFAHDGQITKREMRALTLSALAPVPGELPWDIGAASGSVAIEWMLAHPSLKAIVIEADPARTGRIGTNARNLGVPDLQVVEGVAPRALVGLPVPDAVFIGGGASDPGVIDAAVAALRRGGRLVINAVTLETEALLLARHASMGGDLTRIIIARAEPLGTMTGFRPAMPVTQWRWVKP
jgi:precorrin-6Y C5,15-methyltransferase (decarboxylating)